MGALAALFGVEDTPKASVTKSPPKPPKAAAKSNGRKKECTSCGSMVWAMHTKDGLCKECQPSEVQPVKPVKSASTPQASKPRATEPSTTKGATMRKSTLRKSKEIKGTNWHDKAPSFSQTSRLKYETGRAIEKPALKTWDLGMTRYDASQLIALCSEGNAADVREILITDWEAPLWVSKAKKSSKRKVETVPAKVEAVEAIVAEPVAADPPEEDYAEIIAKLKAKNRGLKAANTRMRNKTAA